MLKTEKNTILVMGAGAVGGTFGVQLAKSQNNTIFFVARGPHLEAIKRKGLSIQSREGKFILKVCVSDDPGDFKSEPDLILLMVKSYDTESAMERLKPVVSKKNKFFPYRTG